AGSAHERRAAGAVKEGARAGTRGSPTLLFYAGSDKVHEQIGLAISEDGRRFERLPEPVVPVDPAVPWRALRTANPAVVRTGARFERFFQGIAAGLTHVSIGRAVSWDGRGWAVDGEPVLPWHAVSSHVGEMSPDTARAAVFEPAVLFEEGRYRM